MKRETGILHQEFLFCLNPETEPGPGIVLCMKMPFLLGKIVNFKTEEELLQFTAKNVGVFYARVQYHTILVVPVGSLMGYFDETDPPHTIRETYARMADFYYREKIIKNPSYYKKYKLKPNGV